MEQERLRASTLGYTDPIHPSYKATSKCFDEVLNAVLEETRRGNANVLVATHNENSIQVAIQRYVESSKTLHSFSKGFFFFNSTPNRADSSQFISVKYTYNLRLVSPSLSDISLISPRQMVPAFLLLNSVLIGWLLNLTDN